MDGYMLYGWVRQEDSEMDRHIERSLEEESSKDRVRYYHIIPLGLGKFLMLAPLLWDPSSQGERTCLL